MTITTTYNLTDYTSRVHYTVTAVAADDDAAVDAIGGPTIYDDTFSSHILIICYINIIHTPVTNIILLYGAP